MNTDNIFEDAKKIQEYFSEDEKELETVIENLRQIQEISKGQIDSITELSVPGRGTQHYLIEHIGNYVSIQSQLQSLLKDKRDIKSKALDIAIKNSNGDNVSDSSELMIELNKAIQKMKKKAENIEENALTKTVKTKTDEEIDKEIKDKLGK